MSPSYPSAVKSFTTKVDGVDDVMAAHVNDIQDEITAEQTELGVLPKGAYASVVARLDAMAMAMSAHFLIPALRGYWPCSAHTYVASVPYVVMPFNNGFNLTCYNAPTFGYTGFAPWLSFNGANQYASYADHQNFDILGTETHIAEPGLSLGALVRFNNAAGLINAIVTKRNGAGQRSYGLRRLADGTIEFGVSTDGTTWQTVVSATVTLANTWYHVAGVFDPSTRLSVFINGVEDGVLTAAVIASIFNSNAIICIGADDGAGINHLNGKLSQVWLSASNLGVTFPLHLFNQTRGLFGL